MDNPINPSPEAPEGVEDIGRRRFLQAFIGVFSSLIGVVLAVPFIAAVIGRPGQGKEGGFSEVGPVSSFPAGVPVDIAYTEMASDAYVRQDVVHHLWVIKHSDTDVTVYSPICPHLGCRYDWDPTDSRFKCPCHGSVYLADGKVVAGPAPRPLDALPAEIRQGKLYVRWEQFKVGTAQKTLV
jgi:quinol---cytochrome c reductase iron-sulfur subunit, bacillus type